MNASAVEIQAARAQAVTVTEDAFSVDLVDGRTIIVPLVWSPRLWHGTPGERSHVEVFGDGAYLHWPDLDEDLTVAGLLPVGTRERVLNPCKTGWRPERAKANRRR